KAARPSFILNNLIGQSSHAFLKAYAELGRQDPAFAPDNCPVVSCNLTEAELPAIGEAAEGLFSVGPYFADPQARAAAAKAPSVQASAHAAVLMLADAVEAAESPDPQKIRQVFDRLEIETPLGRIAVDPHNQHTSLPVRIGCVVKGAFEIVWQSP